MALGHAVHVTWPVLSTILAIQVALGLLILAELDQWAHGLAQKYAPKEKDGKLYWDNDGDEVRFMRFLNFSRLEIRQHSSLVLR